VIAACDRLASSDRDGDRPAPVPGVPTNKIDAKAAVPACEAAVKLAPDDRRILFQLGRSFYAAKDYEHARAFLAKADALGHILPTNNFRRFTPTAVAFRSILQKRDGFMKRPRRAARHLDEQSRHHRDGKGVPKDPAQAKPVREVAALIASAMASIGLPYEEGHGVPVDYPRGAGLIKRLTAAMPP
jgi:hypothetical protein